MNEFLSECRKIEDRIEKLNKLIQKLKYLSNLKANSIMSDMEENNLDNKVSVLNNLFKEDSSDLKEKLKTIHDENKHVNSEENEFEADTRNSQWQVLTNKLAETIELYRTEQLSHTKEEKKRLKSQFLIVKPDATEQELHELLNSKEGHKLLEKEFKPGASSSAGILKKANERNKNIKKIVDSINELVSLIDELHEMVQNSRKIVDDIEVEIDVSKKTVKEAKKDLQKARKYQQGAMFLKYVFFVIIGLLAMCAVLVIAAICIIVTIKLFFKDSGSSKKEGKSRVISE